MARPVSGTPGGDEADPGVLAWMTGPDVFETLVPPAQPKGTPMTDAATTATADDVSTAGHTFVTALASKDADALLALFADEVDFRALTPGKFWEPQTPAELVHEVILGTWFEPTDVVQAVEAVDTGLVADRGRLSYRLRVANGDG